MQPNTSNWRQHIKSEGLLFQCACHGHFMELNFDTEEGQRVSEDVDIMFYDYPASFWQTIKHWWRQRNSWVAEIGLNRGDAIALRDLLNKYLEVCQKNSASKSQPTESQGQEPLTTSSTPAGCCGAVSSELQSTCSG